MSHMPKCDVFVRILLMHVTNTKCEKIRFSRVHCSPREYQSTRGSTCDASVDGSRRTGTWRFAGDHHQHSSSGLWGLWMAFIAYKLTFRSRFAYILTQKRNVRFIRFCIFWTSKVVSKKKKKKKKILNNIYISISKTGFESKLEA